MRMTQAEYTAYLARQPRASTDSTAKPSESSEAKLHQQILDECKRRGWIAFHGSMAHRAYRMVGENDFHCLLPNGKVLFVECKTAKGKLTTEQLGLQIWMENLGHKMHVIRSIEEFHLLCAETLNGGKK